MRVPLHLVPYDRESPEWKACSEGIDEVKGEEEMVVYHRVELSSAVVESGAGCLSGRNFETNYMEPFF